MGLFCLSTEKTVQDDVQCAIRNLQLFLEDGCEKRSDYLLRDFALKQIENALNRLDEQNDK